MANFKPQALVDKLAKLQGNQQSIETTSQWCIFFRKDAKKVVATWEAEFAKQKDMGKKLAMLYLANDILQNSRRKGPQFVTEFYHKLQPPVYHLMKHGDEKIRGSMTKMIKVWEDRRVFGSSGVKPFLDIASGQQPRLPVTSSSGQDAQPSDPTVEPLSKALREVEEARSRCSTLAEQAAAVLTQDVGSTAAESAQAGLRTLQQYALALQNELGHRERVLELLHQLTKPQEEGKLSAEERLRVCELRVRQFQDTLTAAEAAHSSTPQEEYNPEEGPVPLLEVNGGAPAAPGPPSLNGSSMDQLLAGLGGNQDGGGAMPFSAADLVSQLSQSGTSAQLLLDALAALPKDMPPPAAAMEPSQTPIEPEEYARPDLEEYDPEFGE